MNIWKSLTQDKALAEFLLRHLLKKIDRSCLISEVTDRHTSKTYNEVNHEPLSAIVALRLCFGTKEMESIVESEFARYKAMKSSYLLGPFWDLKLWRFSLLKIMTGWVLGCSKVQICKQ